MNSFVMELKPVIRISKHGIRSIIGKMLNYTNSYEYYYTIDSEKCTDYHCPICLKYKALQEQINEENKKDIPDMSVIRNAANEMQQIAKECVSSGCHCAHSSRKYVNDKKRYNLYQYQYSDRRLPKSALRMYMLLYSLPQELLGETHFLKNIDVSLLAEKLGIHRITAIRCLDMLSSFHYITLSHASSHNHYNIIINDYDSMHLSAKEGGTGYFTITSNMMEQLLSINTVNAIRLEILKLLKADDTPVRGISVDKYLIKDLKNLLPSHMNYENNYNKLHKQPSLFHNDINSGVVHFILKENYSLHMNIDEYELSSEKYFTELTNLNGISLSSEEILNICELTTEFSRENISNSLLKIYSDYRERITSIKSIGALLRSYCRQSVFQSIAA